MRGAAALALAMLMAGADAGHAAECAGNPDVLGTSRSLAVDPAQFQGAEAIERLPLRDHELILTFDDGPRPGATDKVLDALRAECVKATFFVLGGMARRAPELVARASEEGHTIGTHTETHPHLAALPFDKATRNIEQGVADTAAALGGHMPAPFFRAPYFELSPQLEAYLAEHGLMAWDADFGADDWTDISGDQMVELALQRIEARGRGVLMMHDVKPPTVEGLPRLLRELRSRGYRILHAVPTRADTQQSVSEVGRLPATAR